MTATAAHLRLAGIHIYKVRAVIQEKTKKGTVDVYRKDEIVIIGNLDHARAVFKEEKNNAETYGQYSKYSCVVELFEPHIHENGALAYWPDGNIYIDQYRTGIFTLTNIGRLTDRGEA